MKIVIHEVDPSVSRGYRDKPILIMQIKEVERVENNDTPISILTHSTTEMDYETVEFTAKDYIQFVDYDNRKSLIFGLSTELDRIMKEAANSEVIDLSDMWDRLLWFVNADNIIDAAAQAIRNGECFESLKQLGLVEENLAHDVVLDALGAQQKDGLDERRGELDGSA